MYAYRFKHMHTKTQTHIHTNTEMFRHRQTCMGTHTKVFINSLKEVNVKFEN